MSASRSATARAHANIALVKYWGKRDVARNLPASSSLSVTLDGLTTQTTVTYGEAEADTLLIDGQPIAGAPLAHALKIVAAVRKQSGVKGPVLIDSVNTFPHAAGLASSASGMAALALAASKAAGLELESGALSQLARSGSGSATRSIYGGYVLWNAGLSPDGADCVAETVYTPEHWDLCAVIAVVSQQQKKVLSREGMQSTARTSPYHSAFLAQATPDIDEALEALRRRDLARLGRVAERSCLRMHAAMLAAEPALIYLLPESWRVIQAVKELQRQGAPVFFTADAGPNVKIFCAPLTAPSVEQALLALGCVQRIIHARPGQGATLVSP